jgi:AraC-like DNA-binding protein
MVEKEPYLDSSLTIQDLSEQVKMPVKDLSTLINLYMDKHFFDFVNEYRIEKAMQILRDSSQKELTVLEILYEVGFNSKSSFNTSFKKYTGKTPTDYRKKAL